MILFIIILFCFAFLFFWGRTSNFEKNPKKNYWKPLDDMIPNLQRFKKIDEDGFREVMKEIQNAKKEKDNLELSSRHLCKAVDAFSVLSTLLPAGDSPYHDEIANLSSELAYVGDKVLMDIAASEKKAYEPKINNSGVPY